MGVRSSLNLPREHGAWAMLYVPLVAGVLVAGPFSERVVMLALSVTLVFIARESLLDWWRARDRRQPTSQPRRMTLLYLGLAALIGAPLVIVYRLNWLVPLGLAVLGLMLFNAHQALRREDRTIRAEMLAIAGLTLTAPAAFYVTRGVWHLSALLLWTLCVLYFASSVFYVKARVQSLNPRKQSEAQKSRTRCTLYHTALAVALLIFAFSSGSRLLLLAFAPVMVRWFWHLARPSNKVNLQRVGVLELVNSVVFLVFITLTFLPR